MASLCSKLKSSLSGFNEVLSSPLVPPSVADVDDGAVGLEMVDNLEMLDGLEMI